LNKCKLIKETGFSLWWQKKGSGDLTIGFACKIPRFCGALIAGDELKRGVKDLWNYVN